MLPAAACVLACATGPAPASAGPPPAWWSNPPSLPGALVFVGDATGAADEGRARDLAYAKALAQLSTYLGAEIDSQFRSSESQSGTASAQEVELEVTVSGQRRTLQRVRRAKVETRPSGSGFDGYVMLSWPRAEYEAVLTADRQRAEAAWAAYRAAARSAEAHDYAEARGALDAAEQALGPRSAPLPLPDDTIKNTDLLRTALTTLRARLGDESAAAAKVCAVGLRCVQDGVDAPCRGSRPGVVRAAVAEAGRQVSPDAVPEPILRALLEGGSVVPAEARRLGRCLVAVQLSAELLSAGAPFTFVKTGARAVVFDSSAGKITWTHEFPADKVGHVSYADAVNKGFDALEKALSPRLAAALAGR